jgi:hypothetical protein
LVATTPVNWHVELTDFQGINPINIYKKAASVSEGRLAFSGFDFYGLVFNLVGAAGVGLVRAGVAGYMCARAVSNRNESLIFQ